MRTPDDVYALYELRRAEQSPATQRMAAVAAHYHDSVALPMPEIDLDEKYSVPNLISQGINQFAYRMTSVMPDMEWPPLDPNKTGSVKKGHARRQAVFGWWEASEMEHMLGQRARWLVGYAASPVIVKPNYELGVPRYEARNPMMTLPAEKQRSWDIGVDDCIFTYTWSLRKLRETYGATFQLVTKRGPVEHTDDTQVTLIEYVDADSWTLLALGPVRSEMALTTGYSGRAAAGITNVKVAGKTGGGSQLLVLEHVMHDLGITPVAAPGRYGLDRLSGQMDSLLGMRELQGRLTALEVLSVERAIFPNEWAILDAGGNSQVVRMADGRKGEVGEIRGGTMSVTNLQPGVQTSNTINYLERAQRQNGLIPGEWGGESGTNIRTGRRGEQVLSATVDPLLQDYHRMLAHSLQHENKIAVAWATKRMNRRTQFYVSWRGAKGQADYVPTDVFETDNNRVNFSHAGADISQLIVNTAQMQGTDLISQDTARRMNPLVDDADHEKSQITREKIERAGMSAFEQAIVSGQVSLDDWSFVADKVIGEGESFVKALQLAQQRAQDRQASSGPPGSADGPVPAGDPAAQPGLQPGAPSAAGLPQPIEAPAQGQTNLAGLLRSLATTRTNAGR